MAKRRRRAPQPQVHEPSGAAAGGGPALRLEDLVSPLTLDDFVGGHWGKKVFATALPDAVFKYIRGAFHDGDVAEILAECRREDNSRYSRDEVSEMESNLEENRQTVHAPFCFAEGAVDLKRAFAAQCGALGGDAGDAEVGVYFARVGGQPGQWHFDGNHNFTIQVCGRKDWLCAPGGSTATASRGLGDAPRNRHEQGHADPALGRRDRQAFSLAPGSMLYVPPGHWHAVTASSAADVSFSVNLRVASVPLARRVCEAIFADLAGAAPAGGSAAGAAGAEAEEAVLRVVAERLPSMLRRCRIPRCFPLQPEHSDGLRSGASLEYLAAQGYLAPADLVGAPSSAKFGVNRLVAMSTRLLDATGLSVDLRSTSSLTNMDYLNCSVLCSAGLHDAVEHLAREGVASVSALRACCPKSLSGELDTLLRALLRLGVLYEEEVAAISSAGAAGAAAVAGGRPAAKRRRGS